MKTRSARISPDEENDSLVVSRTESNLRVVDLLILAQNLWCQACDIPLSLKNCIHEQRSVFSSTLWVSCNKCQTVTKFDTISREDRAKPLQHRNLANAKKLSFLSKHAGQTTDNVEERKKKRKSLDTPAEISRAKTLKVLKGSQINDITSSSSGEPIKASSNDKGQKIEDASLPTPQDFSAPSSPDFGDSHEPVSNSFSDTEMPENEETDSFDWENIEANSWSDSDDSNKTDSEEELFHQKPTPIPPAPIFCEYCLETQESIKDLKEHYKVHPEFAAFVCGWCKLATKDLKSFERHRRFNHQVVSQFHLCYKCGIVLQKLNRFKLHMKDHNVGRTINCTQCNWAFRTKACLKRHMINHKQVELIECDFCKKKSKTIRHLKEHIRIHIQGLHFTCKYCKTRFGRKYPYQEHMDNCHQLMCPLCLLIFPTLDLVRKHRVEEHTADELERSRAEGEEEFIKKTNHQCDICHKYLYDPKSLRHHVRAVHVSPNSGYDINRRLLFYKPKDSKTPSKRIRGKKKEALTIESANNLEFSSSNVNDGPIISIGQAPPDQVPTNPQISAVELELFK